MTTVYPAIIHEEEGYWVEFPDLSGCFTNGSTLEETMEMAKEALGLYLVSLEENGQAIPAPSNIADISTDEGQTTYISHDMNAYRRDTQAIKKCCPFPHGWQKKPRQEISVYQKYYKKRFSQKYKLDLLGILQKTWKAKKRTLLQHHKRPKVPAFSFAGSVAEQ